MSDQNEKTGAWLVESFQRFNIDPARGLAYLTAHYTGTVAPPLSEAMEKFFERREIKGTGWSQTRHLKTAFKDFAASLTHSSLELVNEDEVLAWLSQWNLDKAKTWNDQRGYIHGLFLFAIKKGWIARSPAAGIELRDPGTRPLPDVLHPTRAERLMAWLEINAPEWIPYFVFCLFAGVRPELAHGETGRLHDDLIGIGPHANKVMNSEGFWVRGKMKTNRFVRWADCGPLRAWLNAYPCTKGLIPPDLSIYQAARRLTAIRAKHELSPDKLGCDCSSYV